MLHSLVATALADPRNAWSLGTFGAVAEFQRDRDEIVTLEGLRAVTGRGGIGLALPPDVHPVVHECHTATGWNGGVAFCLPRERARASVRRVLTELGPDRGALHEADRGAILFDLGLGALQCDCLVRVREPHDVERLRAACGMSLLQAGTALLSEIAMMSPQRVFVSRLGRIEVYQPVPAPDGKSPEGPHTHVLPRMLKAGRTHAATLPVPEGLAPCLELHPPGGARDLLDAWRTALAAPVGRP